MPPSLVFAFLVAGSAFAAALVAVLALWLVEDRRRDARWAAAPGAGPEPYVFLFDDHRLMDASAAARVFLRALPGGPDDWHRLLTHLGPRFPGLAQTLASPPAEGGMTLRGSDGSALCATGGPALPLRLAFLPAEAAEAPALDIHCQRAQTQELECLRRTIDALRMPVWQSAADGTVLWVNRAYLSESATNAGQSEDEPSWPPPNLLDHLQPARGNAPPRLRIPGNPPRWFEVETVALGECRLHVASPAGALVKAETSRDEMMQTLAKTFAELPIGLAVFDRRRQLALFNPALSDLTGLRPDFLMSRPPFHAFFDRLRDLRMIPEPRDYHGWRQEIADIEKAAATGNYEDTWNMPSGATYRVTAHPHPDGALALWFADVSADMSLTRRFRAEVQTCQDIFDQLDVAIAVFSPAGVMTQSNGAFSDLWSFDATLAAAPVDTADMIALWQAQTEPTPAWERLTGYLSDLSGREAWSAEMRQLSGAQVQLRATPLGGGSVMLAFHTAHRAPHPPQTVAKRASQPVV